MLVLHWPKGPVFPVFRTIRRGAGQVNRRVAACCGAVSRLPLAPPRP